MVEEQSYRILPTALNVFVVLFALLTAMHFLIVPESYRTPMIILAAIALATGSLMRVFVGHRLMRENANVALIVLAGLVALNAAAHLYLSGDIKQTTNLLFLVVLWGYVFHDSRSYVVVLVATLAGWAGIAGEIGWNDITRHYAFAMVLATALSIFLHVFRRMTVKQLVDLRKTTLQLEETREQARSDESLIRTLMRNVPAGVIVYGTDRRIQFVNPFALDILRADAETLVGAQMGDLSWQLYDERGAQVPVEDLPAHRVFQTGEPVTDELFSMRHPDGKRSYVIITAFPIFGEEGDRMVVSTFADASERMEAERRLRENENLSRAILNSIADGVIAVDKQDRITHFNPAAQRVTGRHRDEAVGQPLSDIFHFREDHMTSTIAFSQGFVERKGGDEVFVELLTAELFDRNGEHLGNVLTFRDMSEQLRIEQQRSTLDKMASVGVLAGGIAHDFNNLLVGLYGNVSLAQASAGEPEKQSGFLDRAMDSLDKATKLTKQLLTFATGSDPVRRVTGVETLVRETTKFALSGSSTSAEFDIDKDLWDIEADAGQLHQALANVIINAKQAMNDKGHIVIGAHNRHNMARSVTMRPGSYVEISVKDTGPGIEPAVKSKVFDPYFTTRPGGTGLGLATTHSIISKHGGTIAVESTPGEGTIFLIYLPAIGMAEEEEAPASAVDVGTETSHHVLVLDDEAIVLDTVSRLLEHLGHRVATVKDGVAAIRAYGQQLRTDDPFDCVIMDLTIVGGMGGGEAAAGILEIDPDAKLIVSSGYSDGAEMADYRAYGFSEVLEKPFSLDGLRQTLRRLFTVKH